MILNGKDCSTIEGLIDAIKSMPASEWNKGDWGDDRPRGVNGTIRNGMAELTRAIERLAPQATSEGELTGLAQMSEALRESGTPSVARSLTQVAEAIDNLAEAVSAGCVTLGATIEGRE